jgi:MFS family permease
MVSASITSGALVHRVGYYTPVMIFGVCIMSIGAGLLTTLQVDTPQPKWIGYQFLYGFGLGCTFQAPNLAAQTVLPTRDVPIGTSLMFFVQLLSGAIFISVGQNVLNTQLLERLAPVGFNAEFLQSHGATTITDLNLTDAQKATLLFEYNEALRRVFQVGLILTCLTIFGAVTLEWRSVKAKKPEKKNPASAAEEGKKNGEGSVTDTNKDKDEDEDEKMIQAKAGGNKPLANGGDA